MFATKAVVLHKQKYMQSTKGKADNVGKMYFSIAYSLKHSLTLK